MAVNKNFDRGYLFDDNGGVQGLDLEQKRLVLRLRFFQLISRGTVPETNRFLKALFGHLGEVYVLDGLDMTATYVFRFQPPSAVLYVLERFDLLPRPAGVSIRIQINPRDVFGFAPYYLNFDRGSLGE